MKRDGSHGWPAGTRMPAEWEPHAATWLGFPHNTSDWPGKLAAIPWVYGEIARHLAPGEAINLIVENAAHENKARRVFGKVGIDPARIAFYRFPTNRGWTRDFGPIVVRADRPPARGGKHRTGNLVIARFAFNAWAKYPDWKKDNEVPGRVARALRMPIEAVVEDGRPVVLEGGAIDVNGTGTLLTTEECLLHPTVQVRNPAFGRADYQRVFESVLGAPNTIWLGDGIAGDDTHGHVDDLARFVNRTTVVACREDDPSDPNHRPLRDAHERLAAARLEDGRAIDVVSLPMPHPLRFEGRRLPASYANFYIGNAVVLVPTFNDPRDRIALGILAELFPTRAVIGIHAVDLVWGLGTLHCLTQQQPAIDSGEYT